MVLETLFLIGLIGAVAGGIAYTIRLVILTIKFVVDWFRKRNQIKQADKDNIAFTLQDKIGSGEYKTVQGVFNTRTNEIVEGQTIESEKLDPKMQDLHSNNQLVIFD